jgi:hypothetical protein
MARPGWLPNIPYRASQYGTPFPFNIRFSVGYRFYRFYPFLHILKGNLSSPDYKDEPSILLLPFSIPGFYPAQGSHHQDRMAEEHPLPKFFADNPSVLFICAQYTDLSGILRVRIVTKQHALRLVAEEKWLVVRSAATLFRVSDGDLDKLPITGTSRLQPDWSSLRACGYAAGHASVMCSFVVDQAETRGLAKICPRTLLSTILAKAEGLWTRVPRWI